MYMYVVERVTVSLIIYINRFMNRLATVTLSLGDKGHVFVTVSCAPP